MAKELEFFAYSRAYDADEEKKELAELAVKLAAKDDCQRYLDARNGAWYRPPEGSGYTSIEVLPHLKGLPFDNLALAWLHSVQPSTIRVSYGETCTDACPQRVTVYLTPDGLIERISQEISVGYSCGANIESVTRARFKAQEDADAVLPVDGV